MTRDTIDACTTNQAARIPEGTFHGEFRCNACRWLYYQLPTAGTTCPRCGESLEIRSIRFIRTLGS